MFLQHQKVKYFIAHIYYGHFLKPKSINRFILTITALSYILNLNVIPSTQTSPLCAFVFVQFRFLQPHPHIGHVYEIYTYININFLDLFVAGRTRVRAVDQIQLTGMLS